MSETGINWAARRVLVTGAAGFIGSHLSHRLACLGAELNLVDDYSHVNSRPIRSIRGQPIKDMNAGSAAPRILDEFGPDVIFHLAGSSSVPGSILHPVHDLQNNVVPTLHLLEALKRGSSALLVFASSAAVYGEPAYLPVDEQHPTLPTSPYGVSKLSAERYVSVYADLHGVRAISLRLFSVYGPGLRKQVVFDLIQKLSGRDPEPLWGDGTQIRDLLYISDVVSAMITVASKGCTTGTAYNVCSGHGVSIMELEREIRSILRSSSNPGYRESGRPGDPERWIGDAGRLQALGFSPKVQLHEGLHRTVDWMITSRADFGD